MTNRHSEQHGFTLIELMIVVAIIGILAAVAVPLLINYMQKSRASEAKANLRVLFDRVHQYRVTQADSFPANTGATPAGTCCVAGGNRCTPTPAVWAHPTWDQIGFAMNKEHFYRYEVVSDNAANPPSFRAFAYGDLDCDGITSTYEISGYYTNNDVVMNPLTSTRPLE